MVTRHLRIAGYLVLACSLAQCASLGRRASLAYTAIAAQLAPDEVRASSNPATVDEGPMPYEIIVGGVYPDQS